MDRVTALRTKQPRAPATATQRHGRDWHCHHQAVRAISGEGLEQRLRLGQGEGRCPCIRHVALDRQLGRVCVDDHVPPKPHRGDRRCTGPTVRDRRGAHQRMELGRQLGNRARLREIQASRQALPSVPARHALRGHPVTLSHIAISVTRNPAGKRAEPKTRHPHCASCDGRSWPQNAQ
jgi:hypothetical protein